MSLADELDKLNELRLQGILTDQEFETRKRMLLGQPESSEVATGSNLNASHAKEETPIEAAPHEPVAAIPDSTVSNALGEVTAANNTIARQPDPVAADDKQAQADAKASHVEPTPVQERVPEPVPNEPSMDEPAVKPTETPAKATNTSVDHTRSQLFGAGVVVAIGLIVVGIVVGVTMWPSDSENNARDGVEASASLASLTSRVGGMRSFLSNGPKIKFLLTIFSGGRSKIIFRKGSQLLGSGDGHCKLRDRKLSCDMYEKGTKKIVKKMVYDWEPREIRLQNGAGTYFCGIEHTTERLEAELVADFVNGKPLATLANCEKNARDGVEASAAAGKAAADKAAADKAAADKAAADKAAADKAAADKAAADKAAAEKAAAHALKQNALAAAGAQTSNARPARAKTPKGFVLIPAGRFTMGSPVGEPHRYDNETPHTVVLSRSFVLQATEVTQQEYTRIMGHNPSKFKGCSTCPVEMVSWHDAINYLNKLSDREGLPRCYGNNGQLIGGTTVYDCKGYRLPTEAEWEYSARAGTESALYGNLRAVACYKKNSGRRTRPVATKRPNTFGLHDMHGNVWEWCHDWDYAYTDRVERDPSGARSGAKRVTRGSGYSSSARFFRAANRNRNKPSDRMKLLGFRAARSVGLQGSAKLKKAPSPEPELPRMITDMTTAEGPACYRQCLKKKPKDFYDGEVERGASNSPNNCETYCVAKHRGFE